MQIRLCDRCQKERANKTFFVVTGRGLDAAGSTDDFGDNVDLCGDCAVKLLINIVSKERRYELNKKILSWAKEGARFHPKGYLNEVSPASLFKRS